MTATPLGTRTLTLKIGAVSRTAEVSNCEIKSKKTDSKFVSFADAAAGGARDYSLAFTAVQDPADATSIWNLVWDNPGSTAAIEIYPYGGAIPSAANPKITGSVIVTDPDGVLLGGDADPSSSARHTFDLEWLFTAKPEKVIA